MSPVSRAALQPGQNAAGAAQHILKPGGGVSLKQRQTPPAQVSEHQDLPETQAQGAGFAAGGARRRRVRAFPRPTDWTVPERPEEATLGLAETEPRHPR